MSCNPSPQGLSRRKHNQDQMDYHSYLKVSAAATRRRTRRNMMFDVLCTVWYIQIPSTCDVVLFYVALITHVTLRAHRRKVKPHFPDFLTWLARKHFYGSSLKVYCKLLASLSQEKSICSLQWRWLGNSYCMKTMIWIWFSQKKWWSLARSWTTKIECTPLLHIAAWELFGQHMVHFLRSIHWGKGFQSLNCYKLIDMR